MIIRNRNDCTFPLSETVLSGVVQEHLSGLPRLQSLREAYLNQRAISQRQRPKGLPNNRLSHGFARYIATLSSGYLLGKPIAYTAPGGMKKGVEALNAAFRATDTDSVDAELAKCCAVYGRGVEIVFADEDGAVRSAALSPMNAFVVYDDTVESRPLFGVRRTEKIGADGARKGQRLEVLTDREIYTYETEDERGAGEPVSVAPHYFAALPLIEYWNNEDETGDFEQVQGLMDAYDLLQSDRVNDKEQFVNALMVLTGARMETDERGRSPAQQLRQDKMLFLPDSDAKAQYLSSVMNENDAQVLQNSLREDIHKFSMVPDLTDEKFSGNASGVALKYKLMGLEQLTRHKERWFREGLKQRIRCYAAFLRVQGAPAVDAQQVQILFARALPVNELETAQALSLYRGLVPEETLLKQVPFLV